jgi:uroporphyrinogen-III synthase
MSDMNNTLPLAGWSVAVPESRQLDLLSDMLTQRGASILRCPLVCILDSPDDTKVKAWLNLFCDSHFDDIIILTGEGIRRLSGFAERWGMTDRWISALNRVRKIARGPKPGNALRELELKPDLLAIEPTTDGVMQTLENENLKGRVIAVQLYGEEPNEKLQKFLHDKGAMVEVVAPYVYASDSSASEVSQLINKIIAKHLDVLIVTSIVQIKRLLSVAKSENREALLLGALKSIYIAAIGPIVADMLESLGIPIAVIPDEKFFMKPLVRKLVDFVSDNPKIVVN